MSGQADWTHRPEGGGRFAIWLIRSIAQYGGRTVSRVLLIPITLYFLIVRGPERRASRAYLSRVFGRPASLWQVCRHIHCFASTILDRVFMLSGQFRSLDVRVRGVEALHQAMDEGRGVLLFGSHHGSFEILRVFSRERPDARVRVVMDPGQNRAITELLDALCPEIASTVIDARMDGASIALAIQREAAEGALVSLLVDRGRPDDPANAVPFLGAPAPFPSAPWLIAAALGIPVFLCFGLYRGGRRYDVHFELFESRIDMPRRQRAERLAGILRRYVGRLEHYVRMAPYNWFNFYDFWRTGQHAPRSKAVSDASG